MKNQIPPQIKGAESIAISKVDLETEQQAINHFELVKKRFQDVNSWEFFAGEEKAEFALHDSTGKLSMEKPEIGNYISIKIPFLHNPAEDGLDWVQVEVYEEEIKDHSEEIYMRLRPTSNPTLPSDKITHFLDSDATSNFIIRRENKTISAEVYARNEIPNTKDKTVLEKIRNKTVALGGMLFGSKIQWEGLTNGLIKGE